VRALRADSAREAFGVDGSGLLVGILSDSFDCNAEATEGDVTDGELPSGVRIVEEEAGCGTGGEVSGTDEGRAMGQLIFDVAPGTNFAFNTAFGGIAGFASGICRLGGVGSGSVCGGTTNVQDDPADAIVDDVINFIEPMFADGVVAQAVDAVVERGIPYFSSAGNFADQSYESAFRPSGEDGPVGGGVLHDFDASGGGVQTFQAVNLPTGASISLSLQWAQPYPSAGASEGASSDLDVFLANAEGDTLAVGNFPNIDRDPIEFISFENNTSETEFRLGIELVEGDPPDLMKYVYSADASDVIDVSASTVFGHANAEGAAAIGATAYFNTVPFNSNIEVPVINPFSALGGTPVFASPDGGALEERRKPDVVGPDGTNNSFFGEDIDADDDSFPNFFGTSAAAPHVTGVAALMLSINPDVAPEEIYQILEDTAIDMDPVRNGQFDEEFAGFDFKTGYGFVNAFEAVQATPGGLRLEVLSQTLQVGDRVRLRLTETGTVDRFVVEICPGSCGFSEDRYRELTTVSVGEAEATTVEVDLPEEAGRYTLRVQPAGPATQPRGLAMITVELGEEAFALRKDGANPFRARTRLRLVTGTDQTVRAVLYDALGRRVRTLVEDREVTANQQTFVRINAGSLASGVYFVRVEGADFQATESVVLVR
jgi:subtilisin family serine protease